MNKLFAQTNRIPDEGKRKAKEAFILRISNIVRRYLSTVISRELLWIGRSGYYYKAHLKSFMNEIINL